jgi:hypothetical protein
VGLLWGEQAVQSSVRGKTVTGYAHYPASVEGASDIIKCTPGGKAADQPRKDCTWFRRHLMAVQSTTTPFCRAVSHRSYLAQIGPQVKGLQGACILESCGEGDALPTPRVQQAHRHTGLTGHLTGQHSTAQHNSAKRSAVHNQQEHVGSGSCMSHCLQRIVR